jgi:hypothetical protein
MSMNAYLGPVYATLLMTVALLAVVSCPVLEVRRSHNLGKQTTELEQPNHPGNNLAVNIAQHFLLCSVFQGSRTAPVQRQRRRSRSRRRKRAVPHPGAHSSEAFSTGTGCLTVSSTLLLPGVSAHHLPDRATTKPMQNVTRHSL